MADQQRPDDLAPIYARLAYLEARERRRRVPRRFLPPLLAALLVALVPLATLAATPFTDLTGGPHDGNIDAIYNAGITKGCDTIAYCPNGLVTREEMASFLARTAGLGGNPPIANALTAQTAQAAVSAQTATNATNAQSAVTAQTATTATNATNAAQLGGRPAADYARAAQIVPQTFDYYGGLGPLPRNMGTFTAVGTRALVILNASGYRASDAGLLYFTASLRPTAGPDISLIALGYTNEAQSHKTVVPGVGVTPLTPGTTYTVRFDKLPDTVVNQDDTMNLTILQLP